MSDPKSQMKQTRDSILGKVAHLRGQLEELSRENAELARQYRASRSECDALIKLKESLLSEQRDSLQKAEALEVQISALKDKLREAEAALAQRERRLQETEARRSEALADGEKLRLELQAEKRRVNELTAEVEDLSARRERLEERHQRAQEEIGRLNEKGERLLEKLNRVEDENRALQERIQQLEQENAEQNRLLEEMLQEFSGMEGTIEGIQTEITTATNSDCTADAAGVELVAAAEVAWLKEKLEAAEQRGDRLEKELARLQAMGPEGFQQEKEAMQSEVRELKIEAESRRNRLQDLEERLTRLQNERDELEPLARDAARLRRELDEKREVLTEAEQLVRRGQEQEEKLAVARERIVALENEILARKRMGTELEARLETLQAEHRQETARREADALAERRNLKKQVDELKGRLRDLLQQDSPEGLVPVAELNAARARIAELEAAIPVTAPPPLPDGDLAREALGRLQEIVIAYEAQQEGSEDIVALLADTFERMLGVVRDTASPAPQESRRETETVSLPDVAAGPSASGESSAAAEGTEDPAVLLREAEHLLDDVEQAYKELLGE